jgi:hypothetical protein
MVFLRLNDILIAQNFSRIKNLLIDYFLLNLVILLNFCPRGTRNPRSIARLYLLFFVAALGTTAQSQRNFFPKPLGHPLRAPLKIDGGGFMFPKPSPNT